MSGEPPEGDRPRADPIAAMRFSTASSHVFVSYASQDLAIADAVVATMERRGMACWIAPRDVTAGALYADAIVRAISSAQALVLVLSANAVASSHVGREVERAASKRRPIIALRIDEAPLSPALEYFLSESQWVDARTGDIDAAVTKLIGAIRERPRDAPAISPPAISRTSAVKAPVASGKSRRNRLVFTVVSAAAVITLAWLLANRFWISKYPSEEKTTFTATPVASAGVTVPAAISDKSIAVLPFLDMSEKKDQEYFADGMAEEIIDLLAKVPDLRVPARTSSFYFKGKSEDVPTIARRLLVTHVLEGSVRKSGNHLRIAVQLIRADNGYHLWSETYDRDLQDVFQLQDDIANAVVQALQITLMGGPLTRQQGGTQNLEAYQLYLRALSTYSQNTKASQTAASAYLNQAVRLDPAFARAWVWLAFNTIVQVDLGGLPPKEGLERARGLAQHALQLTPNLAEAHFVLGYVHRKAEWDWAAAGSEVRQGLSLDPTNPTGLLYAGQISKTLGHWKDAEQALRSGLVRDPLNTFLHFNLGETQYLAGNFPAAEASFRRLRDLAPGFSWTRWFLAKTLLAEGKSGEALAVAQQEDIEEYRLCILPIVLQAEGHMTEADAALKELIAKFADTEPTPIAMVYAYRNDRDLAMHWLDRAYTQKDINLVEIIGEPLFKNLATDPRYNAFLRKMNLQE